MWSLLQKLLPFRSSTPQPSLSLDSPSSSIEDEEWVVVGPEGAVVRKARSLRSAVVHHLECHTPVTITEITNNRARITEPVEGWISLVSQSGIKLLDRPEPEALHCCITKCMFKEPVLVPSSGNTYERSALLKFWGRAKSGGDKGLPRDPRTNVQLLDSTYYPNHAIRSQVVSWLEANPNRTPEGWVDRTVPPPAAASTTATTGGKFGGFTEGQKVCAGHHLKEVKKGEVGIFKGPIRPYDKAISEGLVNVHWLAQDITKVVYLKDLMPFEKRLSVLRRMVEGGTANEALEHEIALLEEATEVREREMEEALMSAADSLKHRWSTERRVSERALLLMGDTSKQSYELLGPPQLRILQKTLRKLAAAGAISVKTREGSTSIYCLSMLSKLAPSSSSAYSVVVAGAVASAILARQQEAKDSAQGAAPAAIDLVN